MRAAGAVLGLMAVAVGLCLSIRESFSRTATPAKARSSDVRGIMSMPRDWAKDAVSDLVARGIIEKQPEHEAAWDKPVSRFVAAAAFARACEVTGRPVVVAADQVQAPDDVRVGTPEGDAVGKCIRYGILVPDTHFGGKGALMRMEFAWWLDRLIGSPAIPDIPPEVVGSTDYGALMDVSEAGARHPEKLDLFSDLTDPGARGTVNRLVFWLILRPPSELGRPPRHPFLPGDPVSRNEFAVCLDRAVRFLTPPRPDTSTPEGAFIALQYAFWKCQFAEADRYVTDEPMAGMDTCARSEMRAARYSFIDAQEFVDMRVTKVKLIGEAAAQVSIEYVAAWDEIESETITMELREGVWVLTGE